MLRPLLLAVSRNHAVRDLLVRLPVTQDVVRRFIAGATLGEALPVIQGLVDQGLQVTVDHLGEDTVDSAQADAVVAEYERLLSALHSRSLTPAVEVSLKLSAVGQFLPDGEAIALANARRVCTAAAAAGTTVTIDMEDDSTTDSTLGIVARLRTDHPWVGAVVQASLRRTEHDCRDLAGPGSRVRLCKGAYAAAPDVAFAGRAEVDLSYVRCMKVLMAGQGLPMLATHDPRLIAVAETLAQQNGRPDDHLEFQMLYGIRPLEQLRLAAAGHTVRVYVAYGTDWYGYFVRRLAERPANLVFFLRSVLGRR